MLIAAGAPEHQTQWLAPVRTGEAVAPFALTEPNVGFDAGAASHASPRRRRLGAGRHQDVDHQRAACIDCLAGARNRSMVAALIDSSSPIVDGVANG